MWKRVIFLILVAYTAHPLYCASTAVIQIKRPKRIWFTLILQVDPMSLECWFVNGFVTFIILLKFFQAYVGSFFAPFFSADASAITNNLFHRTQSSKSTVDMLFWCFRWAEAISEPQAMVLKSLERVGVLCELTYRFDSVISLYIEITIVIIT